MLPALSLVSAGKQSRGHMREARARDQRLLQDSFLLAHSVYPLLGLQHDCLSGQETVENKQAAQEQSDPHALSDHPLHGSPWTERPLPCPIW